MPKTQDFTSILKLDNEFSGIYGTSLLKPEAKIILLLKEKKNISIKEAMILSGMSYSGFYVMINRLVKNGIIHMSPDKKDKRVKRISLGD